MTNCSRIRLLPYCRRFIGSSTVSPIDIILWYMNIMSMAVRTAAYNSASVVESVTTGIIFGNMRISAPLRYVHPALTLHRDGSLAYSESLSPQILKR